jgi:hypothetical protein
MERRDYVLREIEQLSRLARRVLELLGLRRTAEARAEIDAAARATGVDLALLNALANDSILTVLSLTGPADPDRAVVFAELLRLQAEVARAEGNEALASLSAQRGLLLLLHVWSERRASRGATRVSQEELSGRIEELILLVGNAQPTGSLAARLREYRDATRGSA